MTKLSWNKLPLKDLFRLDTTSCLPASQPEQAFLHHSIPAWDESGGPVVELGNTIGSNKFLISHPCVLVSKLNPRKSRVSVVRDVHGKFPQCASTEFMVYLPIHEDADIGFYSWYMTSEYFQRELERVATGTTNSHVRVIPKETLNWKIAQPPRLEQHRIAEILDTIDEAIQKTEALISKLKAMKEGLLHDLLTRGLDKNGKLRDPKSHPEQFKDSPLGRIPKAWEVVNIESIGANKPHAIVDGPFGSNLKSIHYRKKGVPVIQSGFVTNGEFIASEYVYVDKALFQAQRRSTVVPGDIVMAKIGAQCGTCAILPEGHSVGILAGNSLKISTNPDRCRTLFLLRVLHRYYQIGLMDKVITETAQPAISLKNLRAMLIPLPSLMEQDSIVNNLNFHDARIHTEEQYRDKLILQKKGLMHDLLTGKVRVNTEEVDA